MGTFSRCGGVQYVWGYLVGVGVFSMCGDVKLCGKAPLSCVGVFHSYLPFPLQEQSMKLKEELNRKNTASLEYQQNKYKLEVSQIEKRTQGEFKQRLQKELDKRKQEWKTELQSLQKQHEDALRSTIDEIKSRGISETEKLKIKFNDFISKLKTEHSEKLEKQKTELDVYHNNLTKRTLELARKEWELESSFRTKDSSNRKNGRSLPDSRYFAQTDSRAEGAFETVHLENSDSGFTSPLTRLQRSDVSKGQVQHRKSIVDMLASSSNQLPPYEQLLEKLEADIMQLKGEKNHGSDDVMNAERSTQVCLYDLL